jgi:hypothetical protein
LIYQEHEWIDIPSRVLLIRPAAAHPNRAQASAEGEVSMKFVLVLVVLVLAGSAAAAPGCPPGTKYQCMQGKGRVVCSCH